MFSGRPSVGPESLSRRYFLSCLGEFQQSYDFGAPMVKDE